MNTLWYGDNLPVLREHIRDESVALVYLDPPFNSQATYNVLFRAPTGDSSQAQIEAFEDTWHWNDGAERAFDEVIHSGQTDASELLQALRRFLKENDLMAYLTMMAVRLVELHRVLKPTGSLYLHCDPTASHYLKLVLDALFGKACYRTELSWKRSSAHNDAKQGRVQYGNIRDVIFFYTKSADAWTWHWQYSPYEQSYTDEFYKYVEPDTGRRYRLGDLTAAKPGGDTSYEFYGTHPYKGRYWAYSREKMEQFNAEGRLYFPANGGTPSYKRYLDEMPGVPLQNDWNDIKPASGTERLGYATQKPLALLERIVRTSSNAGDVLLDPFCGCGSAVHTAQKLGRQWIGIDITHLAISLIEQRLHDAFPGIEYEVHGTPKDLEGAKALAARDPYQFQWWAVSLVNALPYGGKKKGADSGIDGIIYFKPDGKHTEKAIVSVKGGAHVSVGMIRDLAHVVDREQAKVGLFLTLACPTKPMQTEATKAGWYATPYHGKVPKIQILTIADLLAGHQPQLPFIDPATFRRARREASEPQVRLFG
jgi:DNA modification methylase